MAENSITTASQQKSRRLILAFGAVLVFEGLLLGFAQDSPYTRIDSEWYRLIAQGRTQDAMQPFAARQLDPLLARFLAAVTPLSLDHCFLAVGVASLVVLALCVVWMLCRAGARPAALAALAVQFFWGATFGAFMLPDTLSAALLVLFLVALFLRRYMAAALLLLPMFVARESTILVLLCLLILCRKQLRMRGILLTVAASAAGMGIIHALSVGVRTNREHLGALAYMAGKVPWNFAANVIAMRPWMPSLTNFCAVPRHVFQLPFGLHVGGSALVGFCGWDAAWEAHTFLLALCSFGLLPLVTAYLLRYHRRQLWPDDAFLRFCLAYGLLSFLIAPLLGHTTERLFLYGWPAFLLATPIAASRVWKREHELWVALFCIHALTAWTDIAIYWTWDQRSWQLAWGLLVLVAALNVTAWLLLRRVDRSTAA